MSYQKYQLLKEAVPWQASEGAFCMAAVHSSQSSAMRSSARNALQEVLQWLPVSLWSLQARRAHLEVSQQPHSFSLPAFRISISS